MGTVVGNTERTEPLPAIALGKRIKLLRLLSDMRQQELASAARVSVSHLCKIEAGRHYPHRTTLELIAKGLDTTVDVLTRA